MVAAAWTEAEEPRRMGITDGVPDEWRRAPADLNDRLLRFSSEFADD